MDPAIADFLISTYRQPSCWHWRVLAPTTAGSRIEAMCVLLQNGQDLVLGEFGD